MNLQMRIELAARLGKYILHNTEEWEATKQKASLQNPWYTPEFLDVACKIIATEFLDHQKLVDLTSTYKLGSVESKKIGIVMAGNIPLVGFHDLLCVFLTGHKAHIKPSSKDEVLI